MGKAPDDIRQEIEQTRARMGDTVDAIGYKADVPSRARESVQNTKDSVVGSVIGAKDRVVESIAGSRESVADSLGGARDSIGGVGSSISGSMSNTARRIGDATPSGQDVRQAAQRTVGLAQENPLGLALGATALGFLAGLMIPATKIERQTIGPIADEVKGKVQEAGQEAMDRGKQVASEAADAARQVVDETRSSAQEAAQRATEDLKGTVQEHGQELKSNAQESAQDLTGGSSQPSSPSQPQTSGSISGVGSGFGGNQTTTSDPTQDFPRPGL